MQLIVFINIFIIILACAWSKISFANEDWTPLTSNQSNLSLAIDLRRVVVDGKKVTFWERVEFAQPDQMDEVSGRMIKFKRIQRVMDCAATTQAVLKGSTFGENNKLIEAVILDPAKVLMAPIERGTIAEQQLKIVCAQADVQARVSPSRAGFIDPQNLRISTEISSPSPNQRNLP